MVVLYDKISLFQESNFFVSPTFRYERILDDVPWFFDIIGDVRHLFHSSSVAYRVSSHP